ncbi:MAG: hypothetical protein FWH29_00615 [Methanobrevibacter sp.]|nr:hypothetical protein [Methanobrevibacter sp.]
MTNGEEEMKEGEQTSNEVTPEVEAAPEVEPTSEVQAAPEVEAAPEVQAAPEVEAASEVQTAPEIEPTPGARPAQDASSKKSSKKTILIVLAVLAVCCVGAAVVIFGGGLLLGDLATYNNETVGGHVFKIPTDFKRDSSTPGTYVQFKNDKNQFVRISYLNEQFDLYTFALALASELGTDGNRIDINGTPAYKYNTVDKDGSGQSMYTYAMNIQGTSFIISLSRDIQNPEEFLANIM